MKEQHVIMMGLGYIGLPTATQIASKGTRLTGVASMKNLCTQSMLVSSI